jgi:hypothetical protein
MKKCKSCQETKPLSEFPTSQSKSKGKIYRGYRGNCKLCHGLKNSRNKNLYIKKQEFIKERVELFNIGKKRCTQCNKIKLWDDFPNDSPNSRSWKHKKAYCKVCAHKMCVRYKKTKKGKLMKANSDKKYASNNREKINEYLRDKYKNDILHKLKANIRNRLNSFLRNKGISKYNSSTYSIGCTYEELIKHIESQFKDGMTWENHQLVGGWHIDHIKELWEFDLRDKKQLLMAQHYTNLQPLWDYENRDKRTFYA